MSNNPNVPPANQPPTPLDTALRNKWVFYLGVFAFVLISASAILRLLTPSQTVPESDFSTTNYDQSRSEFSGITYSGPKPDLPSKLSLATTESQTTSESEFIDAIIKTYDLKADTLGNPIWLGNTHSLVKDQGKYVLNKEGFPAANSPGMTIETAITTAQQFVNETLPNANIEVVKDEIVFFNNLYEPQPASAETAELAEVPLSYTVDGFPVFYQHDRAYPFVATVFNTGEVQKLEFYPGFVSLEKSSELAAISVDQAIKNINDKNLGSIVGAETGTSEVVSLSSIQSGKMDSVSLEYRIDAQLGLAVPYYRFTGEVVGESGNAAKVEIITPAVRTAGR